MAKVRTSYSTTPTCRMSSSGWMNFLNQGLSWQNGEQGILAGTLDAFFRGLIIAKLCNDTESNFENKVRFCEKYLYDGTNNEWLPYYEKLKAEVLPTIEPQYNI